MNPSRTEKKERLKELLRNIDEREGDVKSLKEEFKELLREISPEEIPAIEQELVSEGVAPSEIAEMCDAHLEMFRESVEDKFELEDLPKGHPLRLLFRENEKITKDAELLNLSLSKIKGVETKEEKTEALKELKGLASDLLKIDYTHYTRQEMVIFPHIERIGIEAVPRVLWRKHDENMNKVKAILNKLSGDPEKIELENMDELIGDLSTSLMDMVFRENNILYPTLKQLLSEEEWAAVKKQESQLGYYKIESDIAWKTEAEPMYPEDIKKGISQDEISELPERLKSVLGEGELKEDDYEIRKKEDMQLDTGYLTKEEVNSIFKTLPVDITYIDENNRVRYFSETERIFPRTRSIIGRPVKFCHPPSSVDVVKEIAEKFKSGEKEKAEFWIKSGNNFIHIRYFPVKNEQGEYLGTVEITQEVSDIRELEGERRLLNWKGDQ